MAGSRHWRSTFVFAIALALGLLQIVGASSVAIKPRHEHHDEPEGPYEFNFTNEEVSATSVPSVCVSGMETELTTFRLGSHSIALSNGMPGFKSLLGVCYFQQASRGSLQALFIYN